MPSNSTNYPALPSKVEYYFDKILIRMEKLYVLFFFIISLSGIGPGAWAIGINYGLLGDNLPAPVEVISVLKARSITKIRLFEPNVNVLTALKDSGISVIIGTRNEDLQWLATDKAVATSWVQTNVVPYQSSVNITFIAAGNEVIPGELAVYVPGAMQNLDLALSAANIAIPVSTAVSMTVMGPSFPPSQGVFSAIAMPVMTQIITFLSSKRSPLLVNAYTYFPRAGDPANIHLDYALLEDTASAVSDDPFTYHNLFDAMVDTVYAALEKAGAPDVEIVVTETGWPTEGSTDASTKNAQTYLNNVIKHVSSGQGTPRRPNKDIRTYIFALFKENLKPAGIEQNWGLYYPNLTEVYHVNFRDQI